jgi:subtilisin
MLKRAALLCGLAATVGLGSAQAGPEGGNYIVVLRSSADSAAIAASHKQKYRAELTHVYKHALKGYAAKLSADGVAAAKADPDVLFVSEDRELAIAAPPAPPTDNPQVTQRSITRIDGDESSTRSGDMRGSVPLNVAVIDGGIDSDHPDLNVVGGVNCVGDKGGFEDISGHGTLVAGSIGALDNGIGFVGVAPGARLWAVRAVKKNGTLTWSQFICAIDWVTSTRTDSDPANDVAVANASLGGKSGSPAGNADDGNCGMTNGDAVHLAICRSVAAGVTYVVSAGNESAALEAYVPAAYGEVLTATATSDTDGHPGGLGGQDLCGLGSADDVAAFFSNYATTAEDQAHVVAAPGVCVPSTFLGGLYGRDSGTSFASPLVAGTVALCIFAGPCAGLSPAQIVGKVVSDAAAYNTGTKNSGYGYAGDPLRPISGKYYGHLIRAGLY